MVNKNQFKVLDCSLRDGGYYTKWDFDLDFVEEYLESLNHLPIDIIEIGYRSKPRTEYAGAYFYCPEYILKHARKISNKKLAVILNEKDVKIEDLKALLEPCRGLIDLIRLAVKPERIKSSIVLAQEIKKMGFEVSLNLMYMSLWKDNFIKNLNELERKIDFLYLVDSYGGMYPEKVGELVKKISLQTSVPIGFHAHNNLELALANSLAAINSGAALIDSTITGMGRGAGNLKTELVMASCLKADLNYDKLSKVVDNFLKLKENYRWGSNLAYMVSGANSLPQQEVMSQLSKRFYSLNSIVRALSNKSAGLEDNLQLKELNINKKYKYAIIIGGGTTGTSHSQAVKAFIQGNPKTCLIHASSRNSAAFEEVRDLQFHCLEGNEGYRLEKNYRNLEGSKKIAVLPPFPRTMGTYIPEALRENAFQLKEISFTSGNKESVTALAIQIALKLQAEKIFFIGYDGYEGEVSASKLELFNENEALFNSLRKEKTPAAALTPTRYTNLNQESIFTYI